MDINVFLTYRTPMTTGDHPLPALSAFCTTNNFQPQIGDTFQYEDLSGDEQVSIQLLGIGLVSMTVTRRSILVDEAILNVYLTY